MENKTNNWNRGPDQQYSGLMYMNNMWLLSAVSQAAQYGNLVPEDEKWAMKHRRDWSHEHIFFLNIFIYSLHLI